MAQHADPVIPHLGLLVLDVQAAFLNLCPGREFFTRRAQFCVETANLFQLPALFTEQRPDVLGNTIEELSILCPDAPQIPKTGFSAFSEKAVSDWVEKESIHHLLVAGLETPICVYQTVLDALNEDLDVTVLSDAVSGRRSEDAAFVFEAFKGQGVHVLPSETVFYSILRDAKHSSFKEFTQLVKKYSDK